MIKAVKIKDIINRESLGAMQQVSFNSVMGVDEEGKDVYECVTANIHYFERNPEGSETVLMLHGPAQSLYTFRNNFDAVAEAGYRVIIPDLLGCGYSDCPDIDYSVEDMSLSLQNLLANLGILSVHIVAFGQSCGYAADIAVSDPLLVKSLTFIHPGGFRDTAFPKAKSLPGIMGTLAAKSFAKQGFNSSCLLDCYFDKTLITEKMVAEYAKPFERPELKNTLRSITANFDDEELLSNLVAFEKPILLVKSEDDVMSNKEDFLRYLHSAAMGYTASFRNCGYYPHEEKYESFNNALLEFINY